MDVNVIYLQADSSGNWVRSLPLVPYSYFARYFQCLVNEVINNNGVRNLGLVKEEKLKTLPYWNIPGCWSIWPGSTEKCTFAVFDMSQTRDPFGQQDESSSNVQDSSISTSSKAYIANSQPKIS